MRGSVYFAPAATRARRANNEWGSGVSSPQSTPIKVTNLPPREIASTPKLLYEIKLVYYIFYKHTKIRAYSVISKSITILLRVKCFVTHFHMVEYRALYNGYNFDTTGTQPVCTLQTRLLRK